MAINKNCRNLLSALNKWFKKRKGKKTQRKVKLLQGMEGSLQRVGPWIMKDFERIINSKDLERNNGRMVCSMKEIILWVKNMEKELFNSPMVDTTRAISKIISTMGLVNSKMKKKSMKETDTKEKNKGS